MSHTLRDKICALANITVCPCSFVPLNSVRFFMSEKNRSKFTGVNRKFIGSLSLPGKAWLSFRELECTPDLQEHSFKKRFTKTLILGIYFLAIIRKLT
jgi:hypothetical protein